MLDVQFELIPCDTRPRRQVLAGSSPTKRPERLPWAELREAMRSRAKPLAELIARRPDAAALLQAAAK